MKKKSKKQEKLEKFKRYLEVVEEYKDELEKGGISVDVLGRLYKYINVPNEIKVEIKTYSLESVNGDYTNAPRWAEHVNNELVKMYNVIDKLGKYEIYSILDMELVKMENLDVLIVFKYNDYNLNKYREELKQNIIRKNIIKLSLYTLLGLGILSSLIFAVIKLLF